MNSIMFYWRQKVELLNHYPRNFNLGSLVLQYNDNKYLIPVQYGDTYNNYRILCSTSGLRVILNTDNSNFEMKNKH